MNLFDLMAVIKLDSSEYEKGIKDAESKTSKLGSSIGSALKTAGGVAAGAVAAAAVAVGALAKKSVDAYKNYEQLEGGVKKLYGNMGQSLEEYAKATGKSTSEVKKEWIGLERAQNMILQQADRAYMTAGMSANQYMETATSFSAALINSLHGDSVKAAKQTDVAMKAISDNFNTFGGDIGMIQGAFMGFAKQNYTINNLMSAA